MITDDKPPWERYGPEVRSKPREQLDSDRPADARQRGESRQAYRAWLAYLEHGSIRAAARALNLNRRTLERYSNRWRWPERARRILAGHSRRWSALAEFEEKHRLEAASDPLEMVERENAAFDEQQLPKLEAQLQRMLRKLPDIRDIYGA